MLLPILFGVCLLITGVTIDDWVKGIIRMSNDNPSDEFDSFDKWYQRVVVLLTCILWGLYYYLLTNP